MNSYKEVVDWLFVQLPNYQQQGGTAYKPGLETIQKLLTELKNPQEFFRSVHIAGTNGKGSVTHMLGAIFQKNGYKTGIFTSPHLVDFRERIKINGEMVSKEFVVDFVLKNEELIRSSGTTFFEITTAMAFQAFKESGVEVAIIETGMGGRLDSTNVIHPELAIITNIGLDHTQFLGDTLEKVAFEKAGIIKPNVPVVISEYQPETKPVFEKVANERNAALYYAEKVELTSDLKGRFQQKNLAAVWKAVEILKEKFKLDEQVSKSALMEVAELTHFQGRFQLFEEHPTIILDAAHNPAGVKNLLDEINQLEYDQLFMIYGASNDKDVTEVFKMLPKEATYFFSEFNSPRSMKMNEFKSLLAPFSFTYELHSDVHQALERAKSEVDSNDLIVVFGSFFLLSDLLVS